MNATVELSAADARLLALHAQGLLPGVLPLRPGAAAGASQRRRAAAVDATLRHLGAVQLDTISVLARSHELVPYSRLGAVGRDAVESAYWGGGRGNAHPGTATSFEYWSHAACILPVEEWPWFAYRRRSYRRKGIRWHEVPTHALQDVVSRLAAEGPLTTTDLGGARQSAEWFDWSETKIAVEWLLDVGEVVCVRRVGWRRVYDLAERAIPAEHREPAPDWVDDDGVHGPSDAACVRELLRRAGRVMGVGTRADLVDVHRVGSRHVPPALVDAGLASLVDSGDLVPAQVEGWSQPAWAWRPSLDALAAGGVRGRSRTTLLSPFDPVVWERARASRLFGFDFQLEAYVPADKRVHGYFTMPVLHGGRLVARVDPKREGEVLVGRKVTFETGPRGGVPASAVAGAAAAMREAASWVGLDQVRADQVVPASAAPALAEALRP
ncbi:MAG: winged helix-turn-helix domain-containing protein [Candidatus Nanopelagicales bacterium]|jgi:uncharacterized protein YcaQ